MSRDILTRLREATGPSRDLDEHVQIAALGPPQPGWSYAFTPLFSSSIDASFALVGRMLPGCEIELTDLYSVARCTLHHESGQFYGSSEINSFPLAILTALFSAIQEKENENGSSNHRA